MTELNSLKFYPITTTLEPKTEKEGKGRIGSPVSVSYGKQQQQQQEKRKLMLYFP